jgi:hypothetical protein
MIILNGILNTVFFPPKPPTETKPKLSPALRQKDHRGYNSGQALGEGGRGVEGGFPSAFPSGAFPGFCGLPDTGIPPKDKEPISTALSTAADQ